MNISNEDIIERLELGEEFPYDTDFDLYPSSTTPSTDWAHTAARGILADLCDRRGIKSELDKVDLDVRIELTQTIAAIIRMAYSRKEKT